MSRADEGGIDRAVERSLSAIDCVVKLEKKGERGLITIDAKFLHDKEF